MKSARKTMDIIAAYQEVGTYRGAAVICGTTHHTVKRAVERASGTEPATARATERDKNTDIVASVVAAKVRKTNGSLLPLSWVNSPKVVTVQCQIWPA
jgi:hypothetical protein